MSADIEAFQLSLSTHQPTPDTVDKVVRLREAAKKFGLAVFRESPPSREQAQAIAKIEEAAMWAVKATVIPRQETLLD
jgi:isopenicillin N synthase-like dioxygenase